ncbi:MAG: succinate dehydrogenase cytochrome b subunit [Bacteroidales bacterium]|nr:succinate dehydrogenase cytochrome b subunit [Bacteroidales bacterium]
MSNLAIRSISKKIITGLAGLFLITFLVVHLGVNLTMLVPDGGETFREAAEFMRTNPVIKIVEPVLFAAFIIHIIIGIVLKIQNWMARPNRYSVSNKAYTYWMSKYMFHTGIVVLIFLIIHLINFYFIRLGLLEPSNVMSDEHDFYNQAIMLFRDPLYSVIYLVAFVFLAVHLNHAFQSFFQTIGANHSKYTPVIKVIGTIYSLVISIGFAIIPIYFLFFYE